MSRRSIGLLAASIVAALTVSSVSGCGLGSVPVSDVQEECFLDLSDQQQRKVEATYRGEGLTPEAVATQAFGIPQQPICVVDDNEMEIITLGDDLEYAAFAYLHLHPNKFDGLYYDSWVGLDDEGDWFHLFDGKGKRLKQLRASGRVTKQRVGRNKPAEWRPLIDRVMSSRVVTTPTTRVTAPTTVRLTPAPTTARLTPTPAATQTKASSAPVAKDTSSRSKTKRTRRG